MFPWEAVLIPAGMLLVIPVAIIPAFARPGGSTIVSGAIATAALAVFWLALGGINIYVFGGVNLIVLLIGLLATLTAWALSLNAAAQARRWIWVAVLVVAGYITFLAIFYSMNTFQPCYPEADFTMTCPPENPLKHALIIAGYLTCSAAAFVYGVRPTLRRERKPPEGLIVSSLRAAPSADRENLTRSE
jgi:hypothetical protein